MRKLAVMIALSSLVSESAASNGNGTHMPQIHFIGGAFQKGLQDLANSPQAWLTTAANSGYWLHPMGFAAAKANQFAGPLLSHYKHKYYVYEMDLMGWTDGTNPVQTKTPWVWGEQLQQIDPSYHQAFYAAMVGGDHIAAQLQDVTNRYLGLQAKMTSRGYKDSYFFYSPPSPEVLNNMNAILNGKVGDKSLIEYVVHRVGMQGIALDFPAGLFLASKFPASFPPDSAANSKLLAKQAYEIAKKYNIPLVWVFNGADSDTLQAKQAIEAFGIHPTRWAVDNFADKERAGTPESDKSTLAGQLRQLL